MSEKGVNVRQARKNERSLEGGAAIVVDLGVIERG